jgi:hypothetical protein
MENTENYQYSSEVRDVRLTTIKDVKRLLSRTINQVRKGETDNQTAKVIGYLCNIFIGACEKSEISDRIDTIENILQGGVNEN